VQSKRTHYTNKQQQHDEERQEVSEGGTVAQGSTAGEERVEEGAKESSTNCERSEHGKKLVMLSVMQRGEGKRGVKE
jgi:hypothetical protein